MLFEISDKKKNEKSASHFSPIQNHPATFISSQDDYLNRYLKGIEWEENKMWHFTSNGRYALHDLVIYLANKMASPNCIVTSFNLSVLAAKALLRAWDKRTFNSLELVLNAQKKHNFKNSVLLLDGKIPMTFTRIHAKVALIWNGEKYFTIITSGNLSSNNNIERGIISTCREIFEFDKKWIDAIRKGN